MPAVRARGGILVGAVSTKNPSKDPDLVDLELWRSGDRIAGDRLFEKYLPLMYRFFNRKIGGDVGDIVQATLLTCVEKTENFEGRGTFRSFLFGIASKKLLEHFSKLRNPTRTAVDFSVTSLADLGLTPTQIIRDAQYSRLVLEAMRQIPIERQLLLELYYWEDLTILEISEIYGINEDTMSSRLQKARKVLKEKLGELESDPVALESTIHSLDDHIRQLHQEAIKRFPKLNGQDE